MRKLSIIALFVFAFASITAFAGDKQSSSQVSIFEKASTRSKIVQKINPFTHLVPFFSKDGWVKVGDPKNGKVGWVNLAQLKKSRSEFSKANIRTVFVNVEQSKKNKKPTVNIVAYQNGKKVDKKEAEKLYKKIVKNDQLLQRQFNQQFQQDEQQFPPFGFNQFPAFAQQGFEFFPGFQPIVIIDQNS